MVIKEFTKNLESNLGKREKNNHLRMCYILAGSFDGHKENQVTT